MTYTGIVTFGGIVDIKYFKYPDVVVEKIDQRMESLARPVCRYKYAMTIPTGLTQISTRLEFNADIRQIILKVPVLAGVVTATMKIYDVFGAVIFDSTAKAHSTTHLLVSGAIYTPLAGENTLEITLSAAESEPKTIDVLIYGV